MKSYTDLEQSKVLAKFLPLESADMHYNVVGDAIIGDYQSGISSARSVAKAYKKNPDEFAKNVIPCWSLTALLDAIPQEIFDGEYIINITEGCNNRWVLTYDHYENSNHSYYGLSSGAGTLVDACYELILQLHERKML